MTTEEQIAIAQGLVDTGLVKKVYHSCEMLRDPQSRKMFPVYRIGKEYHYAGIDDRNLLFAYIRTNGPVQLFRPQNVGSCGKSYEVAVPLRVVFFNDHEERDKARLLQKLLEFTFQPNILFQRVSDDMFLLSREESDLQRPQFDANVFYIAVDVLLKKFISRKGCDVDLCPTFPNPICLP